MMQPISPMGVSSPEDREQTALDRDTISEANDQTSEERDKKSEARDERAEIRQEHAAVFDPEAVADRAAARRDRQSSANDRLAAQHDRTAAAADRALAARERAVLVLDGLSGAHLRAPGLAELERDITRAARTAKPFVLAFVDVDDLKALNDSQGHAAGDALLQRVVTNIRKSLRAYDLIIRYGGDEFLCGTVDLSFADAIRRFEAARSSFMSSGGGSYSVGLAELEPADDLSALIVRADIAMYEQRQRRRSG